jgi:general transcription factor 3C polypeptide 5 (transcription factor C subunit 1)
MLKAMIDDNDDLREECNVCSTITSRLSKGSHSYPQERDGWYTSHAFERIKMVLRHKFFSLLEGHPATNEECRALLVNNEGVAKATVSNRAHKLRAGKHNMAKGALRPEDAAVCPS